MFKTIKWNTGSAAARFRHTKKKKKRIRLQAPKHKRILSCLCSKCQAPKRVGPPIKESGFKHKTLLGLTIYKL